jgi:hypothetical protein
VTATELLYLADEMKARGVKSFTCEGASVEFGVPEPALPASKAEAPKDEKCRCGHHADDEHMQGLCIKGCEPTLCAPPEGEAK